MNTTFQNPKPVVASVTMGYGHLRAAHPLAEALGVDVLEVDEPPLAEPQEVALWSLLRRVHTTLSQPLPLFSLIEAPTLALMNKLTMIPSLHEPRDHQAPNLGVRVLDSLMRLGLGRGLVERLRETGAPLVTTFYAPAIIADRAGIERIFCVVTDADCHRIWAPIEPRQTRIHYCAPSRRVVRRLRAFGVPKENITLTGFPLPGAIVKTTASRGLQTRLAERLHRLDPEGVFHDLHGRETSLVLPEMAASPRRLPVRLMFAVGGAGAQLGLVKKFLPSISAALREGRMLLRLSAGTRPEVRQGFLDAINDVGLKDSIEQTIHIVSGRTFKEYYDAFNQALTETDVLWTKPSELSFYAALGLPCVLTRPVGAHERYNQRWLREHGAGLKQRQVRLVAGWLDEWLEDGTLAGAAWAGYLRLPKHGTARVVELVHGELGKRATAHSSLESDNDRADSSHIGSSPDRQRWS